MEIDMTTFTNVKGFTFNLDDFGKDSQYNRYVGWFNPFDGQLGETFKVVITAHTKRELREKLENYS